MCHIRWVKPDIRLQPDLMQIIDSTNGKSGVDLMSEITKEVRISELALIISVPIITSIVFFLPETIQQSLVLDYQDPSIYNLWTSAFVHRGTNHFINNLVAYCILITPIYALFLLANEKTLFRRTILSFLLILPVIISITNIAIIPQGTGAGLSGIGSALFGLLPFSLFLFIHNRVTKDIVPTDGVVVFLVAAGIIASIYSKIILAIAVLLIAGILAAYKTYQIGLDNVRKIGSELTSMSGHFELVLLTVLLFLLSPFVLFPQNLAQNGMVVNVLSHYVGFVIGFFGPATYFIYR